MVENFPPQIRMSKQRHVSPRCEIQRYLVLETLKLSRASFPTSAIKYAPWVPGFSVNLGLWAPCWVD